MIRHDDYVRLLAILARRFRRTPEERAIAVRHVLTLAVAAHVQRHGEAATEVAVADVLASIRPEARSSRRRAA